nr:ARID DNA-binding domain-containing protein [Tanacetum cinerariifolium]
MRQHLDFLQRELRRQREAKLGSCIRQISRDCKEMLKKKLDEIMQYNTTLNQPQSTSTAQDKYGYKTDLSNFAREEKESFKPSKPSIMLKYPESIHFSTKCMIKGTDHANWNDIWYLSKSIYAINWSPFAISRKISQSINWRTKGNSFSPMGLDNLITQEWDFFRNKFNKVVKWFYNHYLERSIPRPIPPTIKGIQIHLFDLYKLVKGLGGYLSVHFCQEFDTVGEILGLSKGNGKEIKECYMKYLDVFTSYFKTARAPQKEYTGGFNQIISKMPTKEKGKDRDCLVSHPWNFGEIGANITRNAVQKAKGKMEHFGVKLEDTEEENDSKEQPSLSHSTKAQDLQGMELGATTSRISDKEDSYNSSKETTNAFHLLNMVLWQVRDPWMRKTPIRNNKVADAFHEEYELQCAEPLYGEAEQVTYVVQRTLCSPKGLALKVTGICKIPLAIGKNYNELITCNVVDMEAYHVMLGRPWQHDVYSTDQVPGVHYAPEVTLNILSLDLLEKQGYKVKYENKRCSLAYMFDSKESQKFNKDNMRILHNNYLEDYFESLAQKNESMGEDLIKIKGNLYSTKVQTFNDYVTFLNLIKQDDLISQEWYFFRNMFNKVVKWFYNHYLERSIPRPIPPTIKGIQIHLFDLYKLVEGLGGYLSVHFCQEFDTIGQILGLSKGNGEEIKECYMKYLDVFTSYFKTARAPQKEYTGGFNQIIPKMPTKEEGKDRDCLESHPWNFGDIGANITRNAVQKAKGKMEHFGVKLEDTKEENDSKEQPILSHSTKAQDLQGMELGASTSRISD